MTVLLQQRALLSSEKTVAYAEDKEGGKSG